MPLEPLDQLRSELVLPALLLEMINSGRWRHPGEAVMRAKIPFIHDPLIFLRDQAQMLRESGPLMRQVASEQACFSEYRGSVVAARELPWIDVEKTLFICSNKRLGDDVGIALDYRMGNVPRVIGSDWHSISDRCVYREISSSFDEFVMLLGL